MFTWERRLTIDRDIKRLSRDGRRREQIQQAGRKILSASGLTAFQKKKLRGHLGPHEMGVDTAESSGRTAQRQCAVAIKRTV